MKQPGNLFFLLETSLYGTNEDLVVKGVKPDVNCDGKVEFGEGLPDAAIFKASADEFNRAGEGSRRRRPGDRDLRLRRASPRSRS